MMANNRMYLVCPRCPEGKALIMLAKYYPSTGWYGFPDCTDLSKCFQQRMDDFFEQHRHDSQWGNGFVLEFEIMPDSHPDDPLSGTYRTDSTE